jgi:PhoH-like ATPase
LESTPLSATANVPGPSPARKHFVIDTNVLLHNPEALFMFDDNQVVIPFTVIEELDKFKKNSDDTGRNARHVIRHLDSLRNRGKLSEGVQWNGHGGEIRVDLGDSQQPPALREAEPDNRIIGVAWQHMRAGHETVFISKDINCRIKSDALGIPTQDFEAQKVDAEHLYTGYTEFDAPAPLIDQLYQEKQLSLADLGACVLPGGDQPEGLRLADEQRPENGGPRPEPADLLYANQFVLLRDQTDPSHTGLARRLGDTDHLIPVTGPRKTAFGILPRNVQQTVALDLLLDDEIKLLTLVGTAGSGKTLLALAAGLLKTLNEQRYDRLLVARPIMPLGRDIGFLPGDVEQKLEAWMQPIFDNFSYLLSTRGGGSQHAESKPPEQRARALFDSGQVVLEPLTYIRGRSIPNQFMIVDEAPKLILTGDVDQIDNPYLDAASNGLSFLVEQLKGNGIVGHTTLVKSERSELARLIAEKL